MENPQKLIDTMNHQITHKRFVRSSNCPFNRVQSHDIITQPKRQEQLQGQWKDTIDPSKLVLGDEIGRGAFGVVYKGLYRDQTVAVKVFDVNDKELMKNGFLREVGIWKDLDHPNVTKMIGATINSEIKNMRSKTESNFCIVSEYVKNGSLRSYLEENQEKKLPIKTVYQFALDIAKGLSYLHSKKIIHFDVKVDNILIDNEYKLKLVDFGASVFRPYGGLFLMPGENGTRGYMAPEILSRGPCGHKCDVYSFGICLWEIYCCAIAYPYDSGSNAIDIYKERPNIPVNCPHKLAQLIQRCWDTKPRNRPEMKDVVVELEEIVKSLGWQAMSQAQQVASCL